MMIESYPGERWALISAFPMYSISTHGRVVNRLTGVLIQPSLHKERFYRLNLYSDKNVKTPFYIHRLVAQIFFPGYVQGVGIRHIDGDHSNNRADNLEMYGKVRGAEREGVLIWNIDKHEMYRTAQAAAYAVGGQPTNVRRVLNGTLKTHKGCRFKYVKDYTRQKVAA